MEIRDILIVLVPQGLFLTAYLAPNIEQSIDSYDKPRITLSPRNLVTRPQPLFLFSKPETSLSLLQKRVASFR